MANRAGKAVFLSAAALLAALGFSASTGRAIAQQPTQALEPASTGFDLPADEPRVENLGYVHLSQDFFIDRDQNSKSINAQFDLSTSSHFQQSNFRSSVASPLLNGKLSVIPSGTAGVYSWEGSLTGFSSGDASIGVAGKAATAFLTLPDRTVVIKRPAGQPKARNGRDIYLVQIRDTSSLPDELESKKDEDEAKPDLSRNRAEADKCSADQNSQEITVLILYSEQARKAAGSTEDITSEIATNFGRSKRLFENSGSLKISLKMAGPVEVKLTETNDFDAMLTSAKSQFKTLRDEHKADIVSTILSSGESTACGLGYILRDLGVKWNGAFNIVPRWCANERFSILHEIGHNVGMGHFQSGCSGSKEGIFDYSCGMVKDGKFATLMGYPKKGAQRILALSGPNITYDGETTGDANHDNAKTFNETRCTVSSFK